VEHLLIILHRQIAKKKRSLMNLYVCSR
jgi:hypothetical protein